MAFVHLGTLIEHASWQHDRAPLVDIRRSDGSGSPMVQKTEFMVAIGMLPLSFGVADQSSRREIDIGWSILSRFRLTVFRSK